MEGSRVRREWVTLGVIAVIGEHRRIVAEGDVAYDDRVQILNGGRVLRSEDDVGGWLEQPRRLYSNGAMG